MIRINLLSDKEKKERLADKKIGIVIRVGFSIIFSLLLLALVMFSALIILEINMRSVKEEAKAYPTSLAKEIEETDNLLKDAKSISQKIGKDSQDVPYWGKVFETISAISPDGVRMTNIHIEKAHVRLVGFAKTREDFLTFQEGLRKDYFKNINSPVSNLVSPNNFDFTIEFDIENKYLDQP
ncbi:MAG: PilN domain-containing protein [Candidatus Moranbacteria bacterium]|nr:PilN domain-containing protein [Candidatus Moranbacteria bacterium]